LRSSYINDSIVSKWFRYVDLDVAEIENDRRDK
jgi:hypothetical protein